MGYLFENMEKIDIQELRRIADQERLRAEVNRKEADENRKIADENHRETEEERRRIKRTAFVSIKCFLIDIECDLEKIESSFEAKYKKVKLKNIIDYSLIGGLKVTLDGKVYDYSLKNRLDSLGATLLSGGNSDEN